MRVREEGVGGEGVGEDEGVENSEDAGVGGSDEAIEEGGGVGVGGVERGVGVESVLQLFGSCWISFEGEVEEGGDEGNVL